MDRLLVITNAAAGGAEDETIDDVVTELGQAYEVEVTGTSGIDELRHALADRAGRPVVVVGGDGSLHAVINVLYREDWLDDTPVALVPLGTGNDFSRSFSLPLDPAGAARAVRNATQRNLDLLVEDGGEVVVNAAHIGVGVDAAREATDLKQRFGRLGFVLGAFRAGFVTPGQRLRVEVDGRTVADRSRRLLQIAVANGRFVGGGTPLAPDADPSDGLADVVLSYALAPGRRFGYAVLARFGRHPARADVETYRGRRVVVSGRSFRCNIDGELAEPVRQQAWSVAPGVLRFLAPPP